MNADSSVTTAEPWSQLPPKTGKGGSTESGKNYADFLVYLYLPISERSISRVAQQQNKSAKYLEKSSSKYYWGPRTTAWDRQEAEKRAVQQQQPREKGKNCG